MSRIGDLLLRTLHAAVTCVVLASVAAAEPEAGTQSQIEAAAEDRFMEVFRLLIEERYSEARDAASAQAESMEKLSPYEQGCIHLTLGFVNQLEGKQDAARESFEKGNALADAPHRGLLGVILETYLPEAESREELERSLAELRRKIRENRRKPPQVRQRSTSRELPRLLRERNPSPPKREPDHWPDGFPREQAQDI